MAPQAQHTLEEN